MENNFTIKHDKNSLNIILADMLMDNILNQVGISIVEEDMNLNEDVHDLLANRNIIHVFSLLQIPGQYHEEIITQFDEQVANLNDYPDEHDFNEAVNVNCIEFVTHLLNWDKNSAFPKYTPVYDAGNLGFEINLN